MTIRVAPPVASYGKAGVDLPELHRLGWGTSGLTADRSLER